MKKIFLLLMLVMLNSIAAWCADGDTFTAYVEVPKTSSWTIQVKMTFKIISESNKTCQIGDGTNPAIDGYPDLTKLELPDKVNNYKIVRIGDNAFARGGLCNITKVVLPTYVTSIGKKAFHSSFLESIDLPSGFSSIGEEAFYGTNITNVNLPSTVTDIGNKAFASCLKLTSFTIPEGVSILNNGLFSGCIKLSVIVWHNGVTSIGNSVFQGCTSLASISIPNSITTIGVGAFENCSSLSSVSLFYGLTDIHSSAFSGCTSLNSITLPNSVTTIGSQAFYQCTNLSTVNLSSKLQMIDQSTFNGCTSLQSITIPTKVASIGAGAFQGCTQLETISIPGNVKTIDAYAFYGCSNLGQLELSEGITKIGYDAFYGCISLGSVTIPSTISTWESYCFDGCTGLKNIVFTNGLTSIGNDAFRGCTSVKSVSIPSSITTIGECAFEGCSALQTVTTEENLSILGKGVFHNCTSLSSFIIPESITYIGQGAFAGCQSLTSIIIPNNITTLNGETFSGCINLANVKLSDNLTTIHVYDFYGCTALQKISIPESVTTIKDYAFNGCNTLTSVMVGNPVPVLISSNTFSNTANSILFVPAGSKAAYEAADYWQNFKEIIEPSPIIIFADANVKAICVANWDKNDDGELSEAEASAVTDLGSIFGSNNNIKTFEELRFFTGLKSISNRAFTFCKSLATVEIPETVETIGDYAFNGCSALNTVNLPNGVKTIGLYAFAQCTNMTKIDIPQSVTTIDQYAFSYSSALTEVVLPKTLTSLSWHLFDGCSGLKNISIPNSVKSIGQYAFSGCSGLETIAIGDGVTSIGEKAFDGCNALKEVYVADLAKWCNIDFSLYQANPLSFAHHLYVGGEEVINLLIPEGVTSIKQTAFSGCSNMVSVTISSGVTSIGQSAFSNCSKVTEVTIGNAVNSIGDQAFANCTALSSVVIPDAVQIIRPDAFGGCTTLVDITIGSGVTEIWQGAFGSSDAKITSVYCRAETIPTTNSLAFYPSDISQATLRVPASSYDSYMGQSPWSQFGTIIKDKYKLIYVIDNAEYKQYDVEVNTIVPVEENPIKEGYTFSGWSEIPETMPAHDVIVTGTFTIVNPVTITAKNYIRKYGEDNPTFDFISEGAALVGTPEITCEATAISPVGTYDIVVKQGSVENYNATYVKGTLTIEQALLTISAGTYTRKQGEENPEFTLTYEGFKNNETEAVLTKKPTATTTATKESAVGDYTVTVSGAEAQNYEISYENGTLKVTDADAVVVTAKSYTRVYGEENPAFEYTSSGAELVGVPEITCEATATSPVGTYDIIIKKGSVTNYNDSYIKGTLTITKAPLKIKAGTYTRKQGEENPEFTLEYEGFKNNETKDNLIKQPTATTTATKESAVGDYTVTVSGAEAQNYEISYENGTLKVTDADAVVVTAKSYTRVYGEENPAFEYTSSGAELVGVPEITCEATATSPVGSYDIIIKKGSVTNYNDSYIKGTLTITKAPLKIKAGTYTRKQGEENPEFTLEYEGFKNNETKDNLTKQPTATTTATKESAVGDYTVTVSGAEAQNYEISYVNGILTVTAVLMGDANDDGKVDEKDIVDIANYTMGKPTSTGKLNEMAADINEDGVVNIADVVQIVKVIVK